MTSMPDSKAALRQRVRAAVAAIPTAERETASAQARERLLGQSRWRNAETILFYAPLDDELDVWPLLDVALKAGKKVCLPRFAPDSDQYAACEVVNIQSEVTIGRFGIREPAAAARLIPLKRLDLVLAPGVAFDLLGRRLGRGKGYYDRLLAAAGCPTCGIAFDQQIVGEIPVESHDVRVNCILTPTRWIEP